MARTARQTPWAQRITDWYFSSELHLAKPDSAIYHCVTSALVLPPDGILFLDDRPVNLEAALDAGWKAHVWRSGAETRTLMNDLRLLPPG
jgi:putative hydrolase of the HAD superfamily